MNFLHWAFIYLFFQAQILSPILFTPAPAGTSAITFVNHGANQSTNATTASVTVDCSATPTGTAANKYIIGVAAANAESATVGDGGTDTFTLRNHHTDANSGAHSATWEASGVTGASRTFTVTATFPSMFVVCVHYPSSGTFDQAVGANNLGSAPVACGTLTPSVSNELLVEVLAVSYNAVPSPTFGSGFTVLDSFAIVNGVAYAGIDGYKIKTNSSAESPIYNQSGGTGFGACDLTSWEP